MRFQNFKKVQECMVYIDILNVHYTMFLMRGLYDLVSCGCVVLIGSLVSCMVI